jgi:hypothetical protein
MGVVIVIVTISAVIGAIWLMRSVPSLSNAILVFAGLATFLGALMFLINYQPEFLDALFPDGPAPDIADLSFNVRYKAVEGDLSDQKWWAIGASNWVLAGSVVNKSDKELTKLKFEVFVKYGANIVGDESVTTQRYWKVPPGRERAFSTYSSAFKNFPAINRNPIWGIKLVAINSTSVETDIIWSPDQYQGENSPSASRQVKTLGIEK